MSSERRPARVFEGYLDTRRRDAAPARDAVLVRSDGPFPEATRKWRLGGVDACLFEGGRIDVVPYRWEQSEEPVEDLGIVLGHVIDGAMELTQRGRTVVLGPGETVLYDTPCPFGLRSQAPHRYMVARIPGQVLRIPSQDRDVLAARPLVGFGGAAVLGALLNAIVRPSADPAPGAGQHLGDAVVACVRALVAEARGAVVGDRSSMLFGELTEWLEAHLADDEVTSERLAAEHFLSPRYVRKLFADHDATVSAYVRRRRLERIRDDLVQPWAATLPVAAIAARWGMREPSAFSRAFVRQFGQAPNSFRRESAGPASL